MNLDEALRDLAEAVAAGEGARGRDARLRAARQVVARRCSVALGLEPVAQPSLHEVIRLAADAPLPARLNCAVLIVHALAIPGLVQPAWSGVVCRLVESALRKVLLRCGYPFGEPVEAKMHVLERLHANLNELMQPMEPTFPNWQGLHAG